MNRRMYMKYIFLMLAIFLLGGCVINPPVREEIIKEPNGQIIEKEIVDEPAVEVDPYFDPFFIEPAVDIPVG